MELSFDPVIFCIDFDFSFPPDSSAEQVDVAVVA